MLGMKKPKDNVTKRKKCMIYPNDTSKMWWDVFISVVLLMSTFTTPLDLAFSTQLTKSENWYWFQTSLDIMFLIDIFLTFNSAV